MAYRPFVTDREMVTALRAGDRLAAGQIYDIYGTRLYAYCHELLGDHKLACDALKCHRNKPLAIASTPIPRWPNKSFGER